jgi:hypothetical protein
MLTALAAAAAPLVLTAGAVQGGTPDGNGHPYVGLSSFYYHGIALWRGSGTMVADGLPDRRALRGNRS